MSYSTFNDYIRNRFFGAENIGSHVVLSVDRQVIDEFCQESNISEQQLNEEFRRLFSEHWDFALKNENFFGLSAIQVYVSHQMEDEQTSNKEILARNYRPRLCQYLQINDNSLNKLFKTDQDKLWGNLKNWAEKNGFNLDLPERREGPWSKVNYPLSQSLLNQQDFKYLPNLYRNAGLNPFEQLCLDDFIGLVEKAETNIFLPNHFKKVKDRLKDEKNEILLYKQIFGHYSGWNGEIIFKDIFDKRPIKEQSNIFDDTLLIFNQEPLEIQIFKNQSPISKLSINSRDIFLTVKKHFKMPFGNVLFFTKDEYNGDWVFSRYLIKGETNLMISSSDETFEYHAKRIDSNCQITNKLSCVITILRISDDYEPNSFWENYFPKVSLPVKIKNGLKLNRKQWMYQAGPDLSFSQPVDAWINGERISTNEESPKKSLRYYEAGLYVLKIRGFSPIRIEIGNPTFENQEVLNGWQISQKPAFWEPKAETFQICGLQNSFITEQDSTSEIRDWIDVNTNRTKTAKNQYSNQVTNALKRTKNGIRY